MNYQEAIDFINNTSRFGIKLGLENTKRLLERLGNPQDKLKHIHIAGTNGKGSTACFIQSILMKAGYRAGMFISPYLEVFEERIRINDEFIPREALVEITNQVKTEIDALVSEGYNHPTMFEIVTAIGMVYFAQEKVDFVVLEVGMGGRYDATNVVTPIISVITSISLDHTERLGSTVDKIAYEKAGIIKPNIPVVVYPQKPEAMEVIREVAASMNSELIELSPLKHKIKSKSLTGQVVDVEHKWFSYSDLELAMIGKHQIGNASLSILTAKLLNTLGVAVSDEAIKEGIKNAKWAGRLELFGKSPSILIDGAHNPDGATKIASTIKEYYGDKIILVLGMLGDKKVDEVSHILSRTAKKVILSPIDNERGIDVDKLSSYVVNRPIYKAASCKEAIELAVSLSEEKDLILIAGSLYLIGEARTILRQMYDK